MRDIIQFGLYILGCIFAYKGGSSRGWQMGHRDGHQCERRRQAHPLNNELEDV